jgi:hypothetical protein
MAAIIPELAVAPSPTPTLHASLCSSLQYSYYFTVPWSGLPSLGSRARWLVLPPWSPLINAEPGCMVVLGSCRIRRQTSVSRPAGRPRGRRRRRPARRPLATAMAELVMTMPMHMMDACDRVVGGWVGRGRLIQRAIEGDGMAPARHAFIRARLPICPGQGYQRISPAPAGRRHGALPLPLCSGTEEREGKRKTNLTTSSDQELFRANQCRATSWPPLLLHSVLAVLPASRRSKRPTEPNPGARGRRLVTTSFSCRSRRHYCACGLRDLLPRNMTRTPPIRDERASRHPQLPFVFKSFLDFLDL